MPTSPVPPDKQFDEYQPAEDMPWNTERVGHLLRRAGFGATHARQQTMLKQNPAQAIESVVNFDPKVDPFDGVLTQMEGLFNLKEPDATARWWIHRMMYTPHPLQEKMALFWHNRFATSAAKVGDGYFMHQMIDLFRQQGLGNYRDLVVSVSRDPAKRVWLDGPNNKKGKANENFGRELMELFTLGVGNYTEHDVKQVSRCFTGWTISYQERKSNFDPKKFDAGEKEIFGQKGNFDGPAAIDLILKQPAASKYLAKKILSEFVHPEPTPEQIDHYAGRLVDLKWEIRPLMKELFASRMFFSDWSYRSKIKSPCELVIGVALALGGIPNTQFLRESMSRMGQPLLYPPSVKGWDGGEDWINANTVLQRFNFGMYAATQRRDEFARRSDLEKPFTDQQIKTAAQIADFYAGILLDGKMRPEMRSELIDYMNRGERNERIVFTMKPQLINTKVRGVLHLFTTSPEFQLA
jgi:uncharacterized protein (DUF1800 family)